MSKYTEALDLVKENAGYLKKYVSDLNANLDEKEKEIANLRSRLKKLKEEVKQRDNSLAALKEKNKAKKDPAEAQRIQALTEECDGWKSEIKVLTQQITDLKKIQKETREGELRIFSSVLTAVKTILQPGFLKQKEKDFRAGDHIIKEIYLKRYLNHVKTLREMVGNNAGKRAYTIIEGSAFQHKQDLKKYVTFLEGLEKARFEEGDVNELARAQEILDELNAEVKQQVEESSIKPNTNFENKYNREQYGIDTQTPQLPAQDLEIKINTEALAQLSARAAGLKKKKLSSLSLIPEGDEGFDEETIRKDFDKERKIRERLEQEILDLGTQLNTVMNDLDTLGRALAELAHQFDHTIVPLVADLSDLKETVRNLQANIANEIQGLKASFKLLNDGNQNIINEFNRFNKELNEKISKMKALFSSNFNRERLERIAAIDNLRGHIDQEIQSQRDWFLEHLNLEIKKIQVQIEFLKQQIPDIEKLKERLEKERLDRMKNDASLQENIDELDDDIANEIVDRELADNQIRTELAHETNERNNAHAILRGDLEQNVEALTLRDNSLEDGLNRLTNELRTALLNLKNHIDKEIQSQKAGFDEQLNIAINKIQFQINTLIQHIPDIEKLKEKLEKERLDRVKNDANLQEDIENLEEDINIEKDAREQADIKIMDELANEANARSDAHAILRGNLKQEVEALMQKDNSLTEAIHEEAEIRANDDINIRNDLGNDIITLRNEMRVDIAALRLQLDNERNARVALEAELGVERKARVDLEAQFAAERIRVDTKIAADILASRQDSERAMIVEMGRQVANGIAAALPGIRIDIQNAIDGLEGRVNAKIAADILAARQAIERAMVIAIADGIADALPGIRDEIRDAVDGLERRANARIVAEVAVERAARDAAILPLFNAIQNIQNSLKIASEQQQQDVHRAITGRQGGEDYSGIGIKGRNRGKS